MSVQYCKKTPTPCYYHLPLPWPYIWKWSKNDVACHWWKSISAFLCCESLLQRRTGRPHPVTEMQCFVSTLVGFPMSVTCWPRLCGSSPPSERPVAALWTPWSPTGVMSIAIPLGVTTPDTSYSDMAAGSEWVLPHGWGERRTGGCQRADLESGCRIGASAFSTLEKGAAGPLAVDHWLRDGC